MSRRAIAKMVAITESTSRNWLRQRDNMGSVAYRQTHKLGKKPGPKSEISKDFCKMLVDSKRNSVRDQLYKVQLAHHGLDVSVRQLRRKLAEYTNSARCYKCTFVKQVASHKNRDERADYGKEHVPKPVLGFFDHILFTDEAYVAGSQAVGNIL